MLSNSQAISHSLWWEKLQATTKKSFFRLTNEKQRTRRYRKVSVKLQLQSGKKCRWRTFFIALTVIYYFCPPISLAVSLANAGECRNDFTNHQTFNVVVRPSSLVFLQNSDGKTLDGALKIGDSACAFRPKSPYISETIRYRQGRIKALRGPRPKIFCGAPQLPSLVNTRGYIKQVTIQNTFSLFVSQTIAMPTLTLLI